METATVLASPQFLDLNIDGFIKILEQEAMDIEEIEVWRAAIKWAKNRTSSDNGQAIRKELGSTVKHIRICAIDMDDLCNEVIPSGVLSEVEVEKVCLSKGKKTKQLDLITFSNEIEGRKKIFRLHSPIRSHLVFDDCVPCEGYKAKVFIVTKNEAIELLPMKFKALKCPWDLVPEGLTFKCHCKISITRITDYEENTSDETPEVIEYCENIEYGKEFSVPVVSEGYNLVLMPKNKYKLKVSFPEDSEDNSEEEHVEMYCADKEKTYENEHMLVRPICKHGGFYLPVKMLQYNSVILKCTKD